MVSSAICRFDPFTDRVSGFHLLVHQTRHVRLLLLEGLDRIQILLGDRIGTRSIERCPVGLYGIDEITE